MATAQQVAALKYLIAVARDGNDLVKRILFFLLDSSDGLTEAVSVAFFEGKKGYTKEEISDAAQALAAMQSCNCSTHLDQLMHLVGEKPLFFSVHYGHYNRAGDFTSEGMFPGEIKERAPGHEHDRDNMPLRYTFWIAEKMYGHSGQGHPLLTPSRRKLAAINLKKPGLYPKSEGN